MPTTPDTGKDTITSNDVKSMKELLKAIDKLAEDAAKINYDAPEVKAIQAKVEAETTAVIRLGREVAKLSRHDEKFTGLQKRLVALQKEAKKALAEVTKRGATPPKDTGKDTITSNDVKNMKEQLKAISKVVADAAKVDGGADVVKQVQEKVEEATAAVNRLDREVAKLSRNDKKFADLKKGLPGLQKEARKALAEVTRRANAPWKITVNGGVLKWVREHKDPALDRIMREMKTAGLEARGLRHISGKIYDVHSGSSSDHRFVGEADVKAKSFAFQSVYSHPKSGPKKHVTGIKVSGY